MKMIIVKFCIALALLQIVNAQDDSYFKPGNNNPVFSGYFADPSIIEIDGVYYIYATTVSKYMEPVVWVSEDLQNWQVEGLEITGEHYFWAPSVLKGKDGKIYLYHTSGFDFKCHLYIGDTPTGPFEKYGYVEKGFDLQIFEDPATGKVYGSSSDPDSRPRLVEFESDPTKDGYLTKVIKEASVEGSFFDYTEGSFILYRNGWYYYMYSGGKCSAESYKVNYARSKNIWGPYEEAPNNPILYKDPSKNIFGPGHHSVFSIGDQHFIVYHREDYYFYPTCSERQICIDKLDFDENNWIQEVLPTNTGVDFSKIIKLKKGKLPNLALGKRVASSGNTKFHDPELALDDNFATSWIGGSNGYLSVDLGKEYEIHKVVPHFLNYDYFLLYKILYSVDNVNWEVYADLSQIARKGYHAPDQKIVNARYVKIQIIRGEGQAASLSEFEIFGK